MAALDAGSMPEYSIERDPDNFAPQVSQHGTRIELSDVHLTSFNGKKSQDGREIAARIMHYLRSMCATGTVKNRHAAKEHIINTVVNVGVIPMVSLEVITQGGSENLGPVAGAYQVPQEDTSPVGGPVVEGVAQSSKKFCAVYDFSRDKTISVKGVSHTVHYDGTAIVAGEAVRAEMLKDELKQGWTQKSQMGVHLCKDFIPLARDSALSRELLGGEYYFEFKLFLNCQDFELNADRNVITNEESDEISWIWEDFKRVVWPNIEAKAKTYKDMKSHEDGAIEAAKKTKQAAELKAKYAGLTDVRATKPAAELAFVKEPKKEADVSHLLAMMVQSGSWVSELTPIVKFGQYIDVSTDILAEDGEGSVLLVEVEYQLSSLFKHQHPMSSYDVVVVWSLGGMTHGAAQNAPWGANGANVAVTLLKKTGGGWELKWGTHNKPVIVLSEVL